MADFSPSSCSPHQMEHSNNTSHLYKRQEQHLGTLTRLGKRHPWAVLRSQGHKSASFLSPRFGDVCNLGFKHCILPLSTHISIHAPLTRQCYRNEHRVERFTASTAEGLKKSFMRVFDHHQNLISLTKTP